ncbi:MAG: hypothetical protein WCC58_10945, partial [Burkholderiales bacterium]
MKHTFSTARILLGLCALFISTTAVAAGGTAVQSPMLFGIPVDFFLFAATLIGVALFHHRTLQVALTGLVVITLYKLLIAGFKTGPGFGGFFSHM